MFTEHRRESMSSTHSSHDDLQPADVTASPAGRTVLRPVLHTPHRNHPVTGNVHHLTRDAGMDPIVEKKPVNLLSGIDRDMFAPKPEVFYFHYMLYCLVSFRIYFVIGGCQQPHEHKICELLSFDGGDI